MTLNEYLQEIIPVLKPTLDRRLHWTYRRGVAAFNKWLGREISIADISPAMIEQFKEVDRRRAGAVRSIMATHDPIKFRCRQKRTPAVAAKPCSEASIFLRNVYEQKYEPLALRSRRPNTRRLYRTTLAMFDKFLTRDATLDDLTDETVSRFASWRLANGLSKHSVNKDLFNILALWRWCHRKKLVDRWPDVQMEKPPRRQPVAWLEPEIKRLYRTVAKLPGKVGLFRESDWWAALLLVAWCSGERIGAIVDLDWSNVDLQRGWIRFVAESRKGGRDDSAVRLSDDAIKALKRIQQASGPVFPWPYARTYLWREYGRILRLAGLPDDAKSKFHRLRKTVASYAEARGANATAMLRHSKREVTEAYLDPRICQQQQPADILFRLA